MIVKWHMLRKVISLVVITKMLALMILQVLPDMSGLLPNAYAMSNGGNIGYSFEETYHEESKKVEVKIQVWAEKDSVKIQDVLLEEGRVLVTSGNGGRKMEAVCEASAGGTFKFLVRYLKETKKSELIASSSNATAFPVASAASAIETPSNSRTEVLQELCVEEITYRIQTNPLIIDTVVVDEANFPDAIFREYVKNNFDSDQDNTLSLSELQGITIININSQPQLISLQGIEHFTELTELYCTSSGITALDVSKNTKLKVLNCDGNQLTSLDLSKNTVLDDLDCPSNKLTSLILPKSIGEVNCSNNQLTSVDLSNQTRIYNFQCDNNLLTTLDLSVATSFSSVSCASNRLTDINLGQSPWLSTLNISNNQLTEINFGNQPYLSTLRVAQNQLTSLDLSGLPKLLTLDCYENQLTSMDTSNNPRLANYDCSKNKLTSLGDLSKNRFNKLMCQVNQLGNGSLDGLELRYINTISIQDNCFTELDLTGIPAGKLWLNPGGRPQNPKERAPITRSTTTEGAYEIDLSGLVKNLDRVTILPRKDEAGKAIAEIAGEPVGTWDATTGKLTVTTAIPEFTYRYRLGVWANATFEYYTDVIMKTDLKKVVFDARGGTTVPDAVVLSGDTVLEPQDPTYAGYFFSGWFKDEAYKDKWNFQEDMVTQDITLYAKWTEVVPEHTVSFDSQGGSSVQAITNVKSGSKITKPSMDPTREGFAFEGWYKESAGTNKWDFNNDIVTNHITLYAKWSDNTPRYLVKFDSQGGGAVADVPDVKKGSKIQSPMNPTKSGYNFRGWFKESSCKTPWDFSTDVVMQDTTLYAKWTKKSSGGGDSGGGTVRPPKPPVTPETTVPAVPITPSEAAPEPALEPEPTQEALEAAKPSVSDPQQIASFQKSDKKELESSKKIVVEELQETQGESPEIKLADEEKETIQDKAIALDGKELEMAYESLCPHWLYIVILLIVWSTGGGMIYRERKKLKEEETRHNL